MKNALIYTIIFISSLYCQCDYDYGDANNDNALDILDIIIIVDVIFDNQSLNINEIDLNFDELVNIYDIIILVERILDIFPQVVQIINIDFNFDELQITWSLSEDYGFSSYNLYYANFIDNDVVLLHSTNNINDTSFIINEFELNEQNYFWIGIKDFTGCELIGNQYNYELPHKNYELDQNGNILNSEFSVSDFKSADQCAECHADHYNEWSSSMHSYSMKSPLFFSYKNKTNELHPSTGERFCMQCHNPASYLTGTDLSDYNTPDQLQTADISQVLKEGISCDICHTVTGISETIHTQENIAASANYKMYPLGNIKFGSIIDPEPNDFHASYYLPTYNTSQMCLPCHDLVVNDVEAEITFTEWNRIPGFSMFGGVSCQDCHMPVKENGYHDHRFIGVDMDLTIPIEENPLFSEVSNLLSSSAEINFIVDGDSLVNSITGVDSLIIPISVKSLTAHSLPSGASFNRESWLELVVYNDDQIIFSSGLVENNEPLDIDVDENLLLFTSNMYDRDGIKTDNITEIDSLANYSLLAYQERWKYYAIPISPLIQDEVEITARLLFRSFKPDFIINHHPEFIDNLPVFEIDSINATVNID